MTAQQAEKLGYLGLGMMGFPMARRLINAGYDPAVWNRSTGKAASLVEAGAKLKAHPRDPFGARLERRFPLRCHEGEIATHRRLERTIGDRSPC